MSGPIDLNLNDYLTLAEAASRYGVSERTLRRWVATGRVRGVRLRWRRGTFFRKEDVPGPIEEADFAGMVTRAEAAEQGCVSERTIDRWISRGWLRSRKNARRRLLVSLDDVLRESRGHRARRAEEDRQEAERRERLAMRRKRPSATVKESGAAAERAEVVPEFSEAAEQLARLVAALLGVPYP